MDDDGRDETVYQAMVVDDDGKGLYSTGLRHGDAMFIADMYPDRPGLEVFSVQENEEHAQRFQTLGAAMRDARTGVVLWSHSPTVNVPSGMAADIDPRHRGFEAWGVPGGLRNESGESIGPAPRIDAWTLWWDGDPLRELLATGRPSWEVLSRSPPRATGPAAAGGNDATASQGVSARAPPVSSSGIGKRRRAIRSPKWTGCCYVEYLLSEDHHVVGDRQEAGFAVLGSFAS